MRLPKKEELKNKDELYLYNHDINPYESFSTLKRIKEIIRLTKKYALGKNILDIGCAQGNIATLLAEEGFETVALDLNQKFLNYAKKKREFGKVKYVCANAMNLPFKKNNFDTVILGEIIEHVAYPEKLIAESKKVLKKEGILIITTPNNHLFLGLLSGIKPQLFRYNKSRKKLLKRQFGPAGKDHLFVFDKNSLNLLLEKQGFEIISEGYVNSLFMNPFMFYILKFIPDFLIKIPFLKSKLSLGLYIVARKK